MRFNSFKYVLPLVFFLAGCSSAVIKPVQRIPGTYQWTVFNDDMEKESPLAIQNASVPGHVQQDILLQLQKDTTLPLDSVLYGKWMQSTQSTWCYSTTIPVTKEILRYTNVDIVFDGLDTYASVYINDSSVLYADNMFRQWRIAARPFLKEGENTLRIDFHPVEDKGLQELQSYPYKLPSGDPVQPAISPFVRKAPFQFGWDWSPRLLTTGIWRPMRLEVYDGIRITNTHVSVKEINDSVAWMNARVDLQVSTSQSKVVLKVHGAFKEFQTNGRDTSVDVSFRVLQPKLWWPNGMGEQHLYTFDVLAFADGFLADSISVQTGIRTSRLVMEADSMGTSFYFVVNDKPVFMQGANYVPQSLMPGSVKDDDRTRLLKDAASVGMNMLRVWGGGVYESDRFYQLCDSLGLLVWQDFMFACAMYPSDSLFMQSVKEEALYQVKRLANHPSVILWCGNNESDVAWKNWGWQKQHGINSTDSTAIITGYQKIFQQLLPGIVQQFDPGKSYVHTSPLSNWGKQQNFNHLNMHYWGVWHGEEPIDSFRVNVPRFMSEYGMQSLPSHEKLIAVNGGREIRMDDPLLDNIQKSYKGNRLLLKYIEDRYGSIQSTEAFCYLSQLHQADAMTLAIESHRMGIPKCMGTLYWQLNDVWDGASWSTIEADGQWKAAHHALRRLYGESLLSVNINGNRLKGQFQRHITNGSTLQWVLQVKDFNGNILKEITDTFFCNTFGSVEIFNLEIDALLKGFDASQVVWVAKVISQAQDVTESLGFFVQPKHLQLKDPMTKVEQMTLSDGSIELKISVASFARKILLRSNDANGTFSENYLTLFPGDIQSVRFYPSRSTSPLIQFKSASLFDYK